MVTRRVLVLGGTAEGRQLAGALVGLAGVEVVYSIAGRVAAPALPEAARIRVGGFDGADGLARYLRSAGVAAVIDATHPYAAVMTRSAVAGCGAAAVPLLVVRRPGWREADGDDWHRVPSLAAAAVALDGFGERVFLTTGRSGVAAFAGLDRHRFLLRSIEAPSPPLPARLDVLLERGPFTVDAEVALMRGHRVDVVVTKDSGGPLTAAKLVAARLLGLPVLVVDRPPVPPGALVAATTREALAWVTRLDGPAGPPGQTGSVT
ncbi:cobalt-precorrin-6A reductase [Parafrankia discariae]|uniref:cobalt-precorrin-6A reductase n=1 Tax=Parafrankia discariae TaxID=365528 RepID=UPI0003603B37|nr:cobalt-precorrin-6A reductase [Parafrankia discariae]